MQDTEQMGTLPIPKLLTKLAVPAVIAQVVSLLYNIVDRIYIGHIPKIGAAALTGAGLFMPLLVFIQACAALACSGGAPLASIALGKKNLREAEDDLGVSAALIIVFSVILTPVFYILAPELLTFFGASAKTLPYALTYSRIYILGTVFVMIAVGLNLFISAQGFAKTAMLSTVIGAVINIVLDPIMIFAMHMGVAGAAVATDISQAVSALWILRFLIGSKPPVRLKKQALKLKRDTAGKVLALGVSTFIMYATESLLSICFNHSLARYGGDIAVGAMTIITSLNNLVVLPLQGLMQGGTPIVSYNYGAKKDDRVIAAFKAMLTAAFVFSFAFWLLTRLAPGMLAGIFTNDGPLIAFTVRCMKVYFAVIFTLAFQMTCQNSFVALGQAKTSLFLACLRKLILLIPLILILPHVMAHRVFAVFLAEPISDLTAAVITTAVFLKKIRPILRQNH
ncbi:MAG: MATE family efflux transporter [Pseudoramibacter sp.]